MTTDHRNLISQYTVKDPEELSRNIAKIFENGGRALAAYLEPREKGEIEPDSPDQVAGILKALVEVGGYWAKDPGRAIEAQSRLWTGYMNVWESSLKRMSGDSDEPAVKPTPTDRRFKDPEWNDNSIFDFLKQMYLQTSNWAEDLVEEADDLDEHTKHKAEFYIRQLADAFSPSNFVLTNPELLRETFATNGKNLATGLGNLAEDIEAGNGDLKIRQTDSAEFEVGKNLATTPGKVIMQNDLCQLIQYSPTTENVLKRPLLIIPPWINKYYILDLDAEKSFIRWAVEQGHTTFVVSWVNPDERQAKKSFEHYMKEGILESLEAVEKATGEKTVNAIGYCVGGTLLAFTLAYLARIGEDDKIATTTFFTTQIDFTNAGDLKVFVDEEQLECLEDQMKRKGYLDGSKMAAAFNMLRPNDLIWRYVVGNYIKGEAPDAFDLLYWSSDSPRMAAANHSYYLRNCYLNNAFAEGKLRMAKRVLKPSDIKIPIYNLATKKDHIAPALSVFKGSKLFGGPVDYVLSGSGHIAGVVNPPSKKKYQYWTNSKSCETLEEWEKSATEHPGSWWTHWDKWIKDHDDEQVPARLLNGDKVKILEDAPGSYVKVRS
ncbi:PHA/PHB synthase family protein [Flexibacterium corallicola]|uniref:PHA/PHB synthase family protein n=1 Tax=Flexibacterium corallicola TaxID=3037259 RepID=UPI00286F7FC6|nr:class I poly(R)-hydroxyalkanoic acid synthase [Pseudovibrio sp. M1P-2-3]